MAAGPQPDTKVQLPISNPLHINKPKSVRVLCMVGFGDSQKDYVVTYLK